MCLCIVILKNEFSMYVIVTRCFEAGVQTKVTIDDVVQYYPHITNAFGVRVLGTAVRVILE